MLGLRSLLFESPFKSVSRPLNAFQGFVDMIPANELGVYRWGLHSPKDISLNCHRFVSRWPQVAFGSKFAVFASSEMAIRFSGITSSEVKTYKFDTS
jgi:hypothetical protein